jgi:rRNA-processing protein CGR1
VLATVGSPEPVLLLFIIPYSRREITLERKRAAEERQQAEELKAKVSPNSCINRTPTLTSKPWQMGARKAARMKRKAGRTKKINH